MAKHYLHISYICQENYNPNIIYGDSLFIVENHNINELRMFLKAECEKRFGNKIFNIPTITSISEISEELFNILCEKKAMMTNKEFDDKQQKYFDDMNSVGLGELILFSKSIVPFVEKESQRNKVLKVVTGICGYQTNAREFAKKISYEDFKNTRGITEATAIGMKLFLLYQCGVDWLRPNAKVVVFGNVGESEQIGEIPPKLPQISQNIEPESEGKSIWIARDCDGQLHGFTKKPVLNEHPKMKGFGYWDNDDCSTIFLDDDSYPFIKDNECVEFKVK